MTWSYRLVEYIELFSNIVIVESVAWMGGWRVEFRANGDRSVPVTSHQSPRQLPKKFLHKTGRDSILSVSLYLHDLTPNSLPMSMFRDINSMDARRAAFHNVGGDQINADQVNINISNNQTGAM